MAEKPEEKIEAAQMYDADGRPTDDPQKAATARATVRNADGSTESVFLTTDRFDPQRKPTAPPPVRGKQ